MDGRDIAFLRVVGGGVAAYYPHRGKILAMGRIYPTWIVPRRRVIICKLWGSKAELLAIFQRIYDSYDRSGTIE